MRDGKRYRPHNVLNAIKHMFFAVFRYHCAQGVAGVAVGKRAGDAEKVESCAEGVWVWILECAIALNAFLKPLSLSSADLGF